MILPWTHVGDVVVVRSNSTKAGAAEGNTVSALLLGKLLSDFVNFLIEF